MLHAHECVHRHIHTQVLTASLQRTLAVASYTQTRAWSLQESRQLYSNARAKLAAAARSKMEALEEQLSRSSSSGSGAASHVLRVVLCPSSVGAARVLSRWRAQACDAIRLRSLALQVRDTHACIHTCMYVCMYVCMHACMHAYINMNIYKYVYIHSNGS